MNFVAYLKLMRISALPTLWSNTLTAVLCGFFGASATPFPRWIGFELILSIFFASSFFYLAGMVLNDFFDAKIDAVERPERVIPSGRISRISAGIFGCSLLALGWGAVEICSRYNENPLIRYTAFVLIACIVGYDVFLKRITIVGPVLMGACRFFNIFFVLVVTGYAWQWRDIWPIRFNEWDYALAYPWFVGIYVAGLTLLSRFESASPKIQRLVGFAILMLIPIDAVICLFLFGPLQATFIICLFPLAMLLKRIVPMS